MIQELDKRLKLARINCGLSRKQVAERLGCSESLIGLYENGSRQPSLSALIKLASIYKVTTDYLLGHEISDKNFLPLFGLTEKQIGILKLTADCFRSNGN